MSDTGATGTGSTSNETSPSGTSAPATGGTAPADTDTTGSPETEGADETGGEGDDAAELLARLPGLWVAAVDSNTSAGDFATMNMDIRPADERTLFSRVDLDPDNSLRFAFSFEEHDGQTELVFRNGGEFQGVLRDTRTALVEVDLQEERWRFCAIAGGCAYVDATFDFDGEDRFMLDVDVLRMMHIDWPARRAETRDVEGSFPVDPEPNSGDIEFPPMPSLRATLSWTEPLAVATDVWLILSTTDCSFAPGSCTPSRFMSVNAPAGATQVDIVLEQLHPGEYKANAILDRNGNVAGVLFPDTGDTIAIPNQTVSVDPTGESTTSMTLSFDL